MRLSIHTFLAFAFCMCYAYSQPNDLGYEPPAGWTYVMNLDSVDVLGIHAHNDTIVLHGFNLRQPSPPSGSEFKLYSLNGGTTWDTLIEENFGENTGFLGGGFFPQSNRVYRLLFETDPVTFVQLVSMRISNDLGKTFPERYDYDTLLSKALIGINRKMFFHPLAPDEGFYIRGQSIFYTVFRTHDGGKTWQVQPMPLPRDGNGVFYQILPDARNPKVWNARVNGADHSWVDDFYQTRDDGKTFKSIKQWGEFAGIGYEGEVRSWWNTHTYTTVGFFSSGEQGDSVKLPWLKLTAPDKPDPDFDGGYYYSLSQRSYTFLNKSPDTSAVIIFETKFEKLTDSIEYINSYIYRTLNDGETWEDIWKSDISANNIYLDQRKNTIWARSYDYKTKKFNNPPYPPHFSLYRQKLFTSIKSEVIDKITIAKLSPNPAENQTQLQYTSNTSGKTEIKVFDLFGILRRTIYSGFQEAGSHTVLWNIPQEIPKGIYFIHINTGNSIAIEKLIIQ